MKLFKKIRKGFTLIELVVVIAVIAILSAVAVVSYISITNRAKESNDHSLIDQINTSVQASSIISKKHTLYDVLEDLKEDSGFGVEKLKPELKDAEFVYSYSMNKFAYWKDNKVVYPNDVAKNAEATGIDLWFFKDVQSDTTAASLEGGKSYYVKSIPSTVTTLNVQGGLDLGTQTVENINYSNSGSAQSVVIRTNGGALKINAPADSVKHYGKAGSLNIEKIASTSYREYGEVGYAKIANGRLVVEQSAAIEGIYLVANSSGEFDGIKLAVVGNAKLPSIGRADVELVEGTPKLVVEVQTLATSTSVDSNPEYVWISKTGSEVSAVVSSSNNAADYDANIVSEPSQAAQATKEEAQESSTPIDDNSVARIGAIGYASWNDAYNKASGKTLVLLKNVELSSSISLNKSFTLDLNGNTLSSTKILFNIYGSYNLTIKDSGKDGEISVTANKIIYASSGSVTLESGSLFINNNSNYVYGVQVGSSASFVMNGGSITATGAAPANWWQSYYCYAVSSEGNTVINGGVITAESGGGNYAVNSSGTLTINGGRIVSSNRNNNGNAPYAAYVTGGTATITGGDFEIIDTSTSGWSEGHLVTGSTVISGGNYIGKYSQDIDGVSERLASGYSLNANADGSYTVVKA